ncbi:hypothetical protein PAXRUDRAFT_21637 [Paxillus rubicundulus Ve08.2h10]|uniref:Uncharacterized protein n=1 Tax=Paxillus rubicundulus Ve08.2h10 TaxID=930991 RepID=A0A0D0D729_9AGAM|nr:hypothetical protein PAXRUDRAFT_21637 [Paxillus rubicundulus Ve08.2h10]
MPPIPRTSRRVVQTAQLEGAARATASPLATPVLELDVLSITSSSSVPLPSSARPIRAMLSRGSKGQLTQNTAAASTQAGPATPSPASRASPSLPLVDMEVVIPPEPGSERLPALNLVRPMTREDIRSRRDKLLRALELPDAIQKMARDLWSNDRDAEGAFVADIAVEFRRAIGNAASVGDVTSTALNFPSRPAHGPVTPIDAHHNAPIMEAFSKFYSQWAELHVADDSSR